MYEVFKVIKSKVYKVNCSDFKDITDFMTLQTFKMPRWRNW